MASIEDFKKLDIRVARVLEVRDHPNADKLLLLKIDTGEKQKQIVAGIKNFYTKEDLPGKQIVIVDNLEAAVIRGEISEGMLLAAQGRQAIFVLIPDGPVEVGSKIR
ncbi:methionine--tRNA ligase subunit beta [Candidatus Omnitrophota bacterium]